MLRFSYRAHLAIFFLASLASFSAYAVDVTKDVILYDRDNAAFSTFANEARWPTGQLIEISYNPANQPTNLSENAVTRSIQEAANDWNHASSIAFFYKGTTTDTCNAADGKYSVCWLTQSDFEAQFGTGVLAIARTRFGVSATPGSPPDIIEADILLNAGQAINQNLSTLIAVLRHEVGHTLGLNHESTQPAIMNAFFQANILDLQQDDVMGARHLYPLPPTVVPFHTITSILDANGDGAGNPLTSVRRIATDTAGNVYVIGQLSDNVFKVAPDGTIIEIIDSTGDGLGNSLDDAFRIAVDLNGNVFVASRSTDQIFKITSMGVISVILDSTGDGMGNTALDIEGMTTDSVGNLYAAARTTDNVFKIEPNGTITQILSSAGDGAGQALNAPNSVAIDSAGNILVAAGAPAIDGGQIFQIRLDNTIVELISSNGQTLAAGSHLVLDSSDNMFVIGITDNVYKISPTASISEIITGTGDGDGNSLIAPFSLGIDTANNVYVAGLGSNNVFRIAPNGNITEIIDRDGGRIRKPFVSSPICNNRCFWQYFHLLEWNNSSI